MSDETQDNLKIANAIFAGRPKYFISDKVFFLLAEEFRNYRDYKVQCGCIVGINLGLNHSQSSAIARKDLLYKMESNCADWFFKIVQESDHSVKKWEGISFNLENVPQELVFRTLDEAKEFLADWHQKKTEETASMFQKFEKDMKDMGANCET